ncbi:4-hydroxy-tetrahydrodipicolinate reductase [bacterium]|nr:4-hydroxy-tetrahydrodipicolinate reductase [candidate division CSSED10-310 bacterium]
MIPVVVWGAGGRMGKRLIRLVLQASDLRLIGAIEAEGHPGIFQDAGYYHGLPEVGVNLTMSCSPEPSSEQGMVLDFSLPGGLETAAAWAQKYGWALASGTTALNDRDRLSLTVAAETVPVMYAPNFSIGTQLLLHFVAKAAVSLPESFDATIHETHHRAKMDRPSGTALAFEQRLKNSQTDRQIEISSHRAAQVFGEHVIRFISPMEDITLAHRALDRDVFAAGAISAGRWLLNKQPGLYAFTDMLEL